MSKTKSLHHIVFATKQRKKIIPDEHKRDLYAYIYGVIKNRKCYVHRINGMSNHIHILIDLHPSIALADLVRDLKQWSSRWLLDNAKFPYFEGWLAGYYGASLSQSDLEACKTYITNQEIHHRGIDFAQEIERWTKENDLEWHPDDLM